MKVPLDLPMDRFSDFHEMSMEQMIEDEFVQGHYDEWELIQKSMDELPNHGQEEDLIGERNSVECLDSTGKLCFEKMGRLFTRVPDHPSQVNTGFLLYTPTSKDVPVNFPPTDKPDTFLPDDFDQTLPLKIIVHGWGYVRIFTC